MKKIMIMLNVLFFAGITNLYALPLNENQPYNKLSSQLVTPHIKWANPYYLGKTKILVVAPVWSQRETVELAQRLDLDYTPLMVSDYNKLSYTNGGYLGVSEEVILQDFKEKLSENYDVIILGKLNWEIIPVEYQFSILRKVREGTGLIYICPQGVDENLEKVFQKEKIVDSEDFIGSGIPFKNLPVLNNLSKEKLISLSQFGKGRVVVLNYLQMGIGNQSLTPLTGRTKSFIYYEYFDSFLAKAVLWAAKKESPVYIKEMSLPSSILEQDKLAESLFTVKLLSKIEERVSLIFLCRDINNKLEGEMRKEFNLKSGMNEISFNLPWLKEGFHFLDFWVKKEEQVLNWGSRSVEVTSSTKIENIFLNKEYYEKGRKIEGRIVLNQTLSPGLTIKLEVLDSFQRIILSKGLEGGQEIPFDFIVEHPLSIIFTAKFLLLKEGIIIQEKTIDFSIPNRERLDDFNFVIWRGGTAYENPYNYISNLVLEQYKKNGVDIIDFAQVFGFSSADPVKFEAMNIAKFNLKSIPYIWRFAYDGKDLVRKPCLTDLKYRQEVEDNLRKYVPSFVPYGTVGYSLGDENFLGPFEVDVCFSPTCIEDFKVYLQKVYGNLNTLNKQWDTDYKSWEQVKPLTLQEAKQKGTFSPWVDHRLHMEEVFADVHKFSQNIIQEMDPGARVGFDGPPPTDSYSGYNWWTLINNHKLINVYPVWTGSIIEQREFVRSFAQKDSFLGMWYGTYTGLMSENDMRYAPWNNLFQGFNSCWWWMGYGCDGASAFTPSLESLPCFKQTTEEIKEIKGGIGKTLLCSERIPGKIAIHYSPSSVHASTIEHTSIDIRSSWRNFVLLLGDSGLPFKFLSSEQIEKGELSNYKVFILPYSQAISFKESEQIKIFAKEGGMIIADFLPGIMDEHGKNLPKSSLAELFGDKSEIKNYGKGQSVLLGDFIKDYEKKRTEGNEDEIKKEILKILAQVNIKPTVRILTQDGKALKSTPSFLFKNGDIEYVGILRDFNVKGKDVEEVPEKGTIEFSHKAYVYDLRKGEFLNYTDKIETIISPARALLFALFPYKIQNIELNLDKQVYKKGDTLFYSIKTFAQVTSSGQTSEEIQNHVFRLEVIGPNHQQLEYYAKNIYAPEGKFSGVIPLSLNEAEGIYEVRVKEIASGLVSKKEINVR